MPEANDELRDIDYFVNRLEDYRKHNEHLTLVLGSRAGALYRSSAFYRELQPFALQSFAGKTTIRQFQACYEALHQEDQFKDNDIDDILRIALEGMGPRSTEMYLASLIRQDLFDVILSCNVDTFLEDALVKTGIPDKQITIYNGFTDLKDPLPQKNIESKFLLINVFGQFETAKYTVRRENYFNDRTNLQKFIRKQTGNDTLVIGYDPVWDAELGHLFSPNEGSNFWYINEDEPETDHFLKTFSNERFVPKIGIHPNHTYDYFVYALFKRYGGKIPAHYITQDFIFNKILEIDTRLNAK